MNGSYAWAYVLVHKSLGIYTDVLGYYVWAIACTMLAQGYLNILSSMDDSAYPSHLPALEESKGYLIFCFFLSHSTILNASGYQLDK